MVICQNQDGYRDTLSVPAEFRASPSPILAANSPDGVWRISIDVNYGRAFPALHCTSFRNKNQQDSSCWADHRNPSAQVTIVIPDRFITCEKASPQSLDFEHAETVIRAQLLPVRFHKLLHVPRERGTLRARKTETRNLG